MYASVYKALIVIECLSKLTLHLEILAPFRTFYDLTFGQEKHFVALSNESKLTKDEKSVFNRLGFSKNDFADYLLFDQEVLLRMKRKSTPTGQFVRESTIANVNKHEFLVCRDILFVCLKNIHRLDICVCVCICV